ncbi:HAMP domain-containing sensor histidine kinase [Neobacillus sp. PS3-34]|uniref:HAMP domain-containing sensor histidine kinase n=1 Tax=Neobacillus sp. PS3-34 TaxID=3070678 RepID=UPI0027DF3BEB|nr:HAMP domain-containing sensor histidine kinase [Neobacillus sp. PS3-34]WML50572.1 HAMP domain-containing sensor histidine kinase [Neobacillus sp. PS3-34]
MRNPMTAIKGFLQLIITDGFDEKKKKEYALIAVSEIDRAERIIRDFLTYAKPVSNKKDKINLAEEIYKIVEIIEPLAHLNTVEIYFDSQPSCFMLGEKASIHQCLLNLFKNSIEAMENGGVLSICTYQDDSNLYVDIKDTGIGMSEVQLKRLGKPFFSTKGDKGTGLGMMTTFTLIKSMNGSIDVSSKLGAGTTFTLSFPLFEQGTGKELALMKQLI